MTLRAEFIEGKQAAAQGKTLADNPYTDGVTKLGTPRVTDKGREWEAGFASIGRRASADEVAAARSVDVRNYGRRYRLPA